MAGLVLLCLLFVRGGVPPDFKAAPGAAAPFVAARRRQPANQDGCDENYDPQSRDRASAIRRQWQFADDWEIVYGLLTLQRPRSSAVV